MKKEEFLKRIKEISNNCSEQKEPCKAIIKKGKTPNGLLPHFAECEGLNCKEHTVVEISITIDKGISPEVGNMREEKKEKCPCGKYPKEFEHACSRDKHCPNCLVEFEYTYLRICPSCKNKLVYNLSSPIQPETWAEKEMQQWDNLDCNEPVEKRMRDANLNGDQRYEIADYWIERMRSLLRSLLTTQKEAMAKKIEALQIQGNERGEWDGIITRIGSYNQALVDALKVLRSEGDMK